MPETLAETPGTFADCACLGSAGSPLQQTLMWLSWTSSYTFSESRARHTCSSTAKELSTREDRYGFAFVSFLALCSPFCFGQPAFRDFNNSIHCKRNGQPYTSLTKLLCGFWYVTFVAQYLSPEINPLFHITLQFLGFHLGYVGRKVGSWPRISHRMSQRSLDLFTGQREHSKCNRGRWSPNSTCFTWARTNPIAKCRNHVAWSRPTWVDKEKYANRQLLLQTKCATNMSWWCLLTRN